MRYPEKENYRRILERDSPSHVTYPPPSKGACYLGAWPTESRPSPDAEEWRDEWGVLWRDADGEVFPVGPAVECHDEIDRVAPPEAHEPRRFERVAEALRQTDRERFFFGVHHPYFLYENAINILGPAEFAVCMLAAPQQAHRLLEMLTEFELGIARQYVRFEPDSVGFSDDYGHQDRLAMSPECWRTFFKPRLQRVADFYREQLGPHVMVNLHSCGCVMPILEDLCEIGLATLHPVQSTANDMAEARRITSGRITLAGCIDGQRLLPFATPQQVRQEVFRKLDLLWEGGGYLPMPEKTHGVPPENIEAMEQAIRDWSRQNVEQ